MNRARSTSTLYRSNSCADPSSYQTQSRLYDCIQSLRRSKNQCWKTRTENDRVPLIQGRGTESTEHLLSQRQQSNNLPMQLPIHATFSWVEHDEDHLFGRTIISMLRTLPLAERNELKVHIFTIIANAQSDMNKKEYLV